MHNVTNFTGRSKAVRRGELDLGATEFGFSPGLSQINTCTVNIYALLHIHFSQLCLKVGGCFKKCIKLDSWKKT